MAKKDEKRLITLDNGEKAEASFPVIVSASRSTDIPALYTDWFFERLRKGYSAWLNPFNRKKYYIAYKDTRFIVFWSKNPEPLLKHLDFLKEYGIGFYIQYTLNDYEKERLEPGVPPLACRINTFRKLVDRAGKGSVIWRFDPLFLSDSITACTLLERIRHIGKQIHEYTEKLVFSFADIDSYRSVKANLAARRIPYRNWKKGEMADFAQRLLELKEAEGWKLTLATCGEGEDLDDIEHNRCIDDRLIIRLAHDSPELMKYLGAIEMRRDNYLPGIPNPDSIDIGHGKYVQLSKDNRDHGQRESCACVKSKDIGQYETCVLLCEYCYANHSKEKTRQNYACHKAKPHCETISGS